MTFDEIIKSLTIRSDTENKVIDEGDHRLFNNLNYASAGECYGYHKVYREMKRSMYNHYCLIGSAHPLYEKDLSVVQKSIKVFCDGNTPHFCDVGYASKDSTSFDEGDVYPIGRDDPWYYLKWSSSSKQEDRNKSLLEKILNMEHHDIR